LPAVGELFDALGDVVVEPLDGDPAVMRVA